MKLQSHWRDHRVGDPGRAPGARVAMVVLGLMLTGGGATVAFAQNAGGYATALQSLTLNPHSVKGGSNVYALVHLNQAATAPFRVALSSSDTGAASVKEAVVFSPGQQNKSVLVQTFAVTSDTNVSISGEDPDGNVASDTVTVRAVTLRRFTTNAQHVFGGTDVTATVELDSAAPSGGVTVNLSSNVDTAAHIASTVHIGAGSTSTSTTVTTHPVSSDTNVTLTAELSGVSIDRALEVQAPDVSSMDVTPNIPVNGGQTNAKGHVSLTGPAPAGYTAALSSSDGATASVPATVTFAEGSKKAEFDITVGHPLNFSTATITAVAGAKTRSDLIHVKGLHISVRFADAAGGGSGATITHAAAFSTVNLRILLSEVASGDEPLTLSSSDSSRVLVPANSKVINGHSERSIILTVGPGTGPVTITVTLTHNGDVAHAAFNVD